MNLELIGLIKSAGYLGVWAIIFAESGILFGVLLPGDTLLFTVGVLSRQGYFDLSIMTFGCFLSAFAGNLFGYWTGKRYGLAFARRYAHRFVSEDQLLQTSSFFVKHGILMIGFARFIPVVRTIAPFLAGVSHMNYRAFVAHSAFGALLWAVGLPLAGYYFGKFIPEEWMQFLILPVILIMLIIIVWPYAMRWYQNKKLSKRLKQEEK